MPETEHNGDLETGEGQNIQDRLYNGSEQKNAGSRALRVYCPLKCNSKTSVAEDGKFIRQPR